MPRHACAKITRQFRLTLPQMRATADIKDQAVGRINLNHRRIAFDIIGNRAQPLCVGNRIMIDRLNIGHPRARVGKHHPRADPKRQRDLVARDDPHRPFLLFDKNDRRAFGFTRPVASRLDPVRRKQRQVQREVTPRRRFQRLEKFVRHGSTPYRFQIPAAPRGGAADGRSNGTALARCRAGLPRVQR